MKRTLFILFYILLYIVGNAQFTKQYGIVNENFAHVSKSKSIEFQLNISDLRVNITDEEYVKIEADMLMGSMIKGEPELPILTKLIFLPLSIEPNLEILDFNKDKIDFADQGFESYVKPAAGSVAKSNNINDTPIELSANYKQDAFVNKDIVELKYVGIFRNQQVYELVYYPIAYNPVQNKIEVFYNVKASVKWNEPVAINSKWKFTSSSNQYNFAVAKANNTIVENDGKKTLLIVSPLIYKTSLESFVYWKKSLGYNVVEAYIGEDIADASKNTIKSFIENFYNHPDEGSSKVSYLLLVGDVSDIPAWSGTEGIYATDLYYTEFTGDFLPEVFYGRMSVTNTSQLENIIAKTIYTEKANGLASHYQNNHLLVSGVDASYAPIYGNGAVKYIKNNYSNESQGITTSYYLYGSGSPILSNSSLAKQSIIDDINNGVGLAYYTAHCATNGWSNPELETSDLSQLKNINKYPFMIGNCCESAKFNSNSFAEDIVRAENKGAVAYIGASDYSYWDEDYYWAIGVTSSILAEPEYDDSGLGVFDAWYHINGEPVENHISTAGEFISIGNMAVQESNSTYKDLYWEIYHLIGDPTFVPSKKSYEQVAAKWSIPLIVGQNNLIVETVTNAYVSLSENGKIIGGAFADASGIATVNFNGLQNIGNKLIEITVSHQDYSVFIDSLDVIPPDGPYLTLDNYTIIDSNENNNGLIEYNERVLFDLVIKNHGVELANNALVSLNTNNIWVDSLVNSAQVPFGNILPNAESKSQNSFVLYLNKNIPNKTKIDFSGTIRYNDTLSSQFNFNIEVYGPDIVFVNADVDNLGIGNLNEVLEEGELATVNVFFQNIGASQISNTTIEFTSQNIDLINVMSDKKPFGGFASNEKKSVAFDVQVATEVFSGSNVEIDYVINAGETQQINYSGKISLILGQEPDILMAKDSVIEIVNGNFYDSGGADSNYSNKENTTITFKPYYNNQGLSVDFSVFDLESGAGTKCWDYLEIFDGMNNEAPLIGSYCRSSELSFINSQNPDGALTFSFTSDGSQTKKGWEAHISSSAKHTINLKIINGLGNVQDAKVIFNNKSDSTNNLGLVTFENVVEESNNSFSISKSGYFDYSGEITNIISDTLITIFLDKKPEICFSVSSGVTPIQNARVLFNGEERFTDASGKVFFQDLTEGTKYFYIGADGFIDTSGYVSVPTYDICYFINLLPTAYYSAYLRIYEELGSVDSALVQLNGISKYTNTQGMVTIDSLFPASFKISIFKEGYKDYGNMLVVPDSNFSKEIKILPKTFGVIFNVVHNEQPVQGAEIKLKEQELVTSEMGQALMNGLRIEDSIEFSVIHPSYKNYIDYFNIVDNSVELTVNLELISSILSSEMVDNILVYPNPNNGTFNVSFMDELLVQELSVITQDGKRIYNKNKIGSINKIVINNKVRGLVFLKIVTTNKVLFYPVVIH